MSKYKYNRDCPFETYITDLKNNERGLVGERAIIATTQDCKNNSAIITMINDKYKSL